MDRRRYWFKEQLVIIVLIGKGLLVNHDITGFVGFTGLLGSTGFLILYPWCRPYVAILRS